MSNIKTENAVSYFVAGSNCSQSVVKAFSERTEEETELLLNAALPFGGGVARSGGLCGAVSGALLSIGVKYADKNQPDSKAKVQKLGHDFIQQFNLENGSIFCKDLLQHDISSEAGRNSISELGLRDKICKNLIFSSAEILNKIIIRESL